MAIIHVTEDGPYRVEGEISIRDCTGKELRSEGIWHLCRCGGSRNKPDDLLEPIFRGMDPDRPKHVAAWLAETFGGPATYTAHRGGYEHMIQEHRNRALTEEQRQRWVARLARTADEVLLPNDPDLRQTFVAYLEWGSRIAVFNSQPGVEMIKHAPVPKWGWGNSLPYVPQPWDDPEAATKGRERYAREHSAMPQDRDPHVQPEGQSPSR